MLFLANDTVIPVVFNYPKCLIHPTIVKKDGWLHQIEIEQLTIFKIQRRATLLFETIYGAESSLDRNDEVFCKQ